MKGIDKIKHTKRLVDSHFETLINEYGTLDNDDIIEESLEIATAVFNMAEDFGYNELIAKIIDNE